jgi:hypothetical protein
VTFEAGKKFYLSTNPTPTFIHLSHRFTSASKPAAQKSLDCCLSHFRTSVSTSSSAKRLPPTCESLYATKTYNSKQETFLYEYPLYWVLSPSPPKTHNIRLLFGSTFLKHDRHFDYWKQPMNLRMRVCYLGCHETGLCYYLVIHIENLLRPL